MLNWIKMWSFMTAITVFMLKQGKKIIFPQQAALVRSLGSMLIINNLKLTVGYIWLQMIIFNFRLSII